MNRGAWQATVQALARVRHDLVTKPPPQEALVVNNWLPMLEMPETRFNLWVRKIPWRRSGNPLQYSCLENPMARGAWRAMVHRVPKSQT